MKKSSKLVALAIAALLLAGSAVGCGEAVEIIEIHTPSHNGAAGVVEFDLSLEIVPLTDSPAMPTDSIYPTHPGTNVKSNAKAEIDYTNATDGYVMIRYVNAIDKRLKVRIVGPSETTYDYNLKQDGTWEAFPLSDQNGKYTIGVYENTEDNKYSTSITLAFEVTMKDEFAPFLHPNQYVNFNEDSEVVAKANELVEGKTELTDKIAAVYRFVVDNFSYNKEFAAEVGAGQHVGYLPNVDAILESCKGICFDYAAVMTAMLRSQKIPTRLVIGYAGDIYHAWINVWSEQEGWIDTYIFFDGAEWKLMDPTFASTGGDSGAAQYIGSGGTYTAKFIY